MKKLTALVLLLVLVAGATAYVLYRRANDPFRGYPGAEQFVEIPPGAGTSGIGRRLIAAGVVSDEFAFRVALWLSGRARRLQAGEYRFDHPLSAFDVIEKIARGEVDFLPLTVPEGLTMAEVSRVFEASGLGSASSFVEAAKDALLIRDLDPTASDLEGYLFPDTYALSRRAGALRVVRAMADRFHQVLSEELRAAARDHGLSIRQLVTLASIVEKETARPDERPLVAAVYANRLAIGMGLQCDPTVIYALQRAGRFDGNLRHNDLMFDSPYNTYRHAGLPPGPIAAPGRRSLEAAAHPATTDALYFVSRNDGSHEFAKTLDEHNRNVLKYQIQYFRDRRLAGRGH